MRNITPVGVWLFALAVLATPAAAHAQDRQVGVQVWSGAPGNGGGFALQWNSGQYPGRYAYPSPYDRNDRQGYAYNRHRRSYAFDRGFDDGYREGLDDARDRDRYDPIGEGRYRRGDVGYDHRYGPREYYRRDYREGFLAGYDRAYREVASYYRRPGYGARPGYPGRW